MASRFDAAHESLAWAKEAISELDAELRAFFGNPGVTERITEFDPGSGQYLHKVRLLLDLPKRCRRRAMEALIHARHGFDQIVIAGARSLGMVDFKQNFPWARNPVDLERLLVSRQFPKELWSAIEAQEPYYRSDAYAGGDDLIRNLATVANQKHTVGLTAALEATGVAWDHVTVTGEGRFIVPGIDWNPVKKEIIIAQWGSPETKLEGDYRVRMEVCFKEARLPKSVNVGPALELFASRAEMLLNDVKAVCE